MFFFHRNITVTSCTCTSSIACSGSSFHVEFEARCSCYVVGLFNVERLHMTASFLFVRRARYSSTNHFRVFYSCMKLDSVLNERCSMLPLPEARWSVVPEFYILRSRLLLFGRPFLGEQECLFFFSPLDNCCPIESQSGCIRDERHYVTFFFQNAKQKRKSQRTTTTSSHVWVKR